MGITSLIATAALAFFQSGSVPFDEAGKELLQLAARERMKTVPEAQDIRTRLAPLHERAQFGALELWIPKRVLDEKLVARAGPDARELQKLATELVALQGLWLERMGLRDGELAAARKSLEGVARWTRDFKSDHVPDQKADVVQARHALEKLLLKRELAVDDFGLVLIFAPTRAQYIGTIGAAGMLDQGRRKALLVDGARRSLSAQIATATIVAAWSNGPELARQAALTDVVLSPADQHQALLHSAAHVLSVNAAPSSPSWFLEGLAIGDTIGVLGADETLCSGWSEQSPMAHNAHFGDALGILLWVTRDKSPYRNDPSATYFVAALRSACGREGFEVLDLDSQNPAEHVRAPLLGEDVQTPAEITAGPPGVRRGYAELYRAYCACFVHWLDEQPSKPGRSLLVDLCSELSKIPFDPSARHIPLHEISPRVTGKTLGASTDADGDLEAAFNAWLCP